MMKNINRPKAIFFMMIGSLLVYIIIGKIFDNDTNKNHIYTIGKIEQIRGLSRSVSKNLIFTYEYKEKTIEDESSFLSDSLDYYEPNIGKRFLVKMNNKQWVNRVFSTYKLYINIPVPDSIKSSPQEGWKELPDWARK